MKELFKNRVFRIVMATDIVQQTGIWVRNIAVLFFVIEKTQADPVAVSLVSVAEYLPMFLFAYLGGTLADRWNPKHTMIIGDTLSALSVVGVLLAINLGAWQGIFFVTFLSTVITQFSVPSSAIVFKRFVPSEYINAAISLSQALMSLFLIAGPVIGTLLYATLGWAVSLSLIAVLFLLSAAIQLLLPGMARDREDKAAGLLGEMKEGIEFLREHRKISTLLLLLCIFCFGQGLLQPLTVFILDQQLGLGKESLQWFFAVAGVGLLVGAGLSAVYSARLSTRLVLVVGFLSYAVCALVEVFSVYPLLTGGMYFLNGIVTAFVQVAVSAPLIKDVDEDKVGRINGLVTPILMAGLLLGSGLSGVVMKETGLLPVYLVSAGVMVICSLLASTYGRGERRD
jgi:predicted MFS family arabinose efflux permease